MQYLHIKRNTIQKWDTGNETFFSIFEGAANLIHLVLDFNNLTFSGGFAVADMTSLFCRCRFSIDNKTYVACNGLTQQY